MLRKYLETLKKEKPVLLFFDEMPWLDYPLFSLSQGFRTVLERVGFEAGQSETDSLWFGNHLDDEILCWATRAVCTIV